jgi:acetyl esterase
MFRCLAVLAALPALFAQASLPAQNPPAAAPSAETVPLLADAETFIYREAASEPLRLFVVKPVGWSARDRRTALVFFFGGGWTHGTPERSAAWAKFAAGIGMVGIMPDYRTKERFNTSPLEAVADSRAALRWVQDHAEELGVAPGKIVVGGDSSGGHIALWTAITATPPGSALKEAPRTKPAALLLFSTVSDTSPETGYTPIRFGDQAAALSPLHHLDATMPPVLAFHGDADRTVPFRQAVALRDKLVAGGNACELVIVPGGDHGFLNERSEWRDRAQEIVREFLTKRGLLAPETKR